MTVAGSRIDINGLLHSAGIAPKTAEAVLVLDAMLLQWRRRVAKRELGHRALIDLGIGLDLAQLDVLYAIAGPGLSAEEVGETMVGTVAERLNIDPSRASRMVSDMVDQGFAQRAVSQADARRTIIELTDRGQVIVEAVQAYKLMIMGDFLNGWDPEELATFIPLLRRFGAWSQDIEAVTASHAREVAQLADQVALAMPKPATEKV